MRPSVVTATSLFASLLIIASPLQATAQASTLKNDSVTLAKLEYDWLMAEFKQDTAAIALLMHERFISIGPNSVISKQQELEGIYKNIGLRQKDGHAVDSLYLDDVHIRIYENTSVVTFISVTNGKIKGVPFANRRTRMYDVWIKEAGQWKAVSSQITALK